MPGCRCTAYSFIPKASPPSMAISSSRISSTSRRPGMLRPGDVRHAGPRAGTTRRGRAFSGKVESGFPSENATMQKCWRQGAGVSDDFKALIAKAATGAPLTREQPAQAFDSMMSGPATPSQMGGLLMALRVRGETVDEITGAVTAMRAKMLRVTAPADAVDVVGTGGDGSGSVNVSTCASFIVAGAGVPVAKHGNRALSSRSGAADGVASLRLSVDNYA